MQQVERQVHGSSVRRGLTASGTHYISAITRPQRSHCYLTLAISNTMPASPSLVGAAIQRAHHAALRQDKAHDDVDTATARALQCITTALDDDTARATTKTRRDAAIAARPQLLQLHIELFDDDTPRACDNFRRLCSAHATRHTPLVHCYKEIELSYIGTYFHKIIPGLGAQAGDVTLRVGGGGNYMNSAGRGWFDDESKRRSVDAAGLLCMANNGPDTNRTQFFITTSASQEGILNGRYVCFGRVTRGLECFLREVAPYGNETGKPLRYVVIVNCGNDNTVSS